jgi:hypothetical protein
MEQPAKNLPCVELIDACGEWHVRVVEEDQQRIRSFEIERSALAYVECQRRRLELADFTRI